MNLIQSLKSSTVMFLVNHVLVGTRPYFFEPKRKMLNAIGHSIGKGTKVVGPIECYSKLEIGQDCWIGKNLKVNGNGSVVIGDCCDIAPEVTFQTGSHEIGAGNRRAGKGYNCSQKVGNGTWIGGRSTICNNVSIGNGCVIAGCACVVHDIPDNTLAGGIPAKVIRRLEV